VCTSLHILKSHSHSIHKHQHTQTPSPTFTQTRTHRQTHTSTHTQHAHQRAPTYTRPHRRCWRWRRRAWWTSQWTARCWWPPTQSWATGRRKVRGRGGRRCCACMNQGMPWPAPAVGGAQVMAPMCGVAAAQLQGPSRDRLPVSSRLLHDCRPTPRQIHAPLTGAPPGAASPAAAPGVALPLDPAPPGAAAAGAAAAADAASAERLVFSGGCGRVHMMNVTVQNCGVDWHHPGNCYWRHQVRASPPVRRGQRRTGLRKQGGKGRALLLVVAGWVLWAGVDQLVQQGGPLASFRGRPSCIHILAPTPPLIRCTLPPPPPLPLSTPSFPRSSATRRAASSCTAGRSLRPTTAASAATRWAHGQPARTAPPACRALVAAARDAASARDSPRRLR
jgi:hypothetical protein